MLVGEPGQAGYDELAAELGKRYLPNRIEARLTPNQSSESPLAEGKTLVNGAAALYVCRNFACAAPVTDAAAAAALLESPGERQKGI